MAEAAREIPASRTRMVRFMGYCVELSDVDLLCDLDGVVDLDARSRRPPDLNRPLVEVVSAVPEHPLELACPLESVVHGVARARRGAIGHLIDHLDHGVDGLVELDAGIGIDPGLVRIGRGRCPMDVLADLAVDPRSRAAERRARPRTARAPRRAGDSSRSARRRASARRP